MKVVFASTPDQQEKIMELIRQLYSDVFPNYFSDDEIAKFERLNVLHISSSQFEQLDTLKDAFQVITSLQTLISILESERLDEQYIETYYKNISILEQYGLYFPFEFQQFVDLKITENDDLSIYSKAANELLV
ncbi:YhcU family protein [Bacillus tuaregi]|uniref:YhcU family protein n=1 Tax=Bacillus tuaregi TaxID=1816695 RepID=UPI0008F89E83|nr:YhcU family protein [Bacillus tuaregi]